jgi:hypothetical protein
LADVKLVVVSPEMVFEPAAIVFPVRVWVWAAKRNSSLAERAGMVAVLDDAGATDVMVVVLVVPRTIWLVVFDNVRAENAGVELVVRFWPVSYSSWVSSMHPVQVRAVAVIEPVPEVDKDPPVPTTKAAVLVPAVTSANDVAPAPAALRVVPSKERFVPKVISCIDPSVDTLPKSLFAVTF